MEKNLFNVVSAKNELAKPFPTKVTITFNDEPANATDVTPSVVNEPKDEPAQPAQLAELVELDVVKLSEVIKVARIPASGQQELATMNIINQADKEAIMKAFVPTQENTEAISDISDATSVIIEKDQEIINDTPYIPGSIVDISDATEITEIQ